MNGRVMDTGRKNVLMSAFFCSPVRGSEFEVGWRIASGIAQHHDVTLLTGYLGGPVSGRVDMEAWWKDAGSASPFRVVEIEGDWFARLLFKIHRFPGLWFLYCRAYHRWQKQALRCARKLQAECAFALVPQATIISFREPGYLWQLGIPFFWGPISGAACIPRAYMRDFGFWEKVRWHTRNVVNRMQAKMAARSKKAGKLATKVWVVAEEDRRMFRDWGVECDMMLEVGGGGVDCQRRTRCRRPGEPLRLCWVGRFQGVKALPLLLEALKAFSPAEVRLDVVGNGPECQRWKRLGAQAPLGAVITWHGEVPRERALQLMEDCDVLVHTSLKEATATVIMEALVRGLPVICHNACGMAVAVNASCGLRVDLIDPDTSADGFRHAIRRLLDEPQLLERLSEGALKRSEELSWGRKMGEILGSYHQVKLNADEAIS